MVTVRRPTAHEALAARALLGEYLTARVSDPDVRRLMSGRGDGG